MLHAKPHPKESAASLRLTPTDRVVLVIVDGLRPDAINAFRLYHMARLRAAGASTMDATTVSPASGWAALASLITGISPGRHGVLGRDVEISAPFDPLAPVPELIARAGLPSTAFVAEVPRTDRVFASRIAERLGFLKIRFCGSTAHEILAGARHTLSTQRHGLIVVHLPDLDETGHRHGWMSPDYGEAAKRVDMAIGLTAALADVPRDPRTLLILVSDHGGGGMDPFGHDSDHELDRTIPIILAGNPMPVSLALPASLLDVPATILYALGVPIPASYEGRPLKEAFVGEKVGVSSLSSARARIGYAPPL